MNINKNFKSRIENKLNINQIIHKTQHAIIKVVQVAIQQCLVKAVQIFVVIEKNRSTYSKFSILSTNSSKRE